MEKNSLDFLSFLKTVYFNFKYFPFKIAVKLPIHISRYVKIRSTAGTITILSPIQYGMIKIGFGDVGFFDKEKSRSVWHFYGNVTFAGNADIGHGFKISGGGNLYFGHNFRITAESTIVCMHEIRFGNDCLVSWENLFMDTDFHKIYSQGQQINKNKPIIIGNHVWFGCRCTILKGVSIPDNSVIASNTVISKTFEESNTIIGGKPCHILKRDISWDV
jgi:acetyltransferase-like isoleucine patch superfamily enzyme